MKTIVGIIAAVCIAAVATNGELREGTWLLGRTPVIDGSRLPFGYALSVSLRLTAPPKGGAKKNCCGS